MPSFQAPERIGAKELAEQQATNVDPLDHDNDKRKGGSLKGEQSTAAKGAARRKGKK